MLVYKDKKKNTFIEFDNGRVFCKVDDLQWIDFETEEDVQYPYTTYLYKLVAFAKFNNQFIDLESPLASH